MAKRKQADAPEFDVIIVGSGAGGGPLAARLADKGARVLVIEAGSDLVDLSTDALETTQVPSLHATSTEHPDLSWRFFVKHYQDPPTGQDPKWHRADPDAGEDESHEGIFYPRAAAVGGCTVHNAMITIAGPQSDWDDLAEFLEDPSWRGARMREYFRKLEHNDSYRPSTPVPCSWWRRTWDRFRWLIGWPSDPTRGGHGFQGWLHTSVTDVSLGLKDKQLIKMLKAALIQSSHAGLERAGSLVRRFLKGRIWQSLDPNHARTQAKSPEGVVLIPTAVCGDRTTVHQNRQTPDVRRGRRSSPRELLKEVQARHPDRLTIWTDCLVTRVLFDDGDRPRAVGVELRRGKRLYKAHVQPSSEPGEPKSVFVRPGGEIILCGGAFNTPQLLMLSGIGNEEKLREVAESVAKSSRRQNNKAADAKPECCLHDRRGKPILNNGDPRRVNLPGVGLNLQDRYEVTVISEMKKDFSLLDGATFEIPSDGGTADDHLHEWRKHGTGLYTSNGGVLGIFKRSRPELTQPDLFIFGIPLPFEGYKVGYSQVGDQHRFFTWTILKSHTRNHDGTLQLRSVDPLDTPEINFHYFNECTHPGKSDQDPDLEAIVEGVNFVRGIARHARLVVNREAHPTLTEVGEGNTRQIKDWIQRVAWGHHACGTCRMGPEDDGYAVLDSRFRVRGVDGLRVVDASIFPKIPGYFIVTNIYMASEKAADDISSDLEAQPEDKPGYPAQLQAEEAAAIGQRREQINPDDNKDDPINGEGAWFDNVTGLALSGGGIRSATLCLGILQAMSSTKWLRQVDFLSTVSGGGYIGSCVGRLFDRLRSRSLASAKGMATQSASEEVNEALTDENSPLIGWLRQHGNYIAPRGHGDWRLAIAAYLRNLLSVHFVIGLLLFAIFGLANAIRYGIFDPAAAGLGLALVDKGSLPLGYLLQALLGPFFSPWFVLFELVVLFLVIPRLVGYWTVSQDRHERFQGVALTLVFFAGGLLLFLGVHDGLSLAPLVVGLAVFSSFVAVERAWRRGRVREEASGSGGIEAQRLRTRNYLTYDLGLMFTLAGAALAFALIDTLGHGLQQWLLEENISYTEAFAAIGGAFVALVPVTRLLAGWVAAADKPKRRPSTLSRIFRKQVVAGLLALSLLALPLLVFSFTAHAVYQGGSQLIPGLAATGFAILLSLLLRFPNAMTFVNRSSLSQIYSARLARAYLGASNPLRHRPDGANITEVIANDDVASIRDYRPHESGGPFHLINVMVNQTVDFTSQRGNKDRKGENVAVSCLGMSVGRSSHGFWSDSQRRGHTHAKKRPMRIEPVGYQPGDSHPLVDMTGRPTDCAEMLSLRQWMGISGAAVGPGRGQTTSLGTSLLFGLANLRTGYWWDSGISEAARDGFPKLTALRRILYLMPEFWRTQSLLLFEWLSRFAGPWEQYWNLSDGGFFENTGAYELVRRRVPRIILCDGTADPDYQMECLAELVRKARIDFSAEATPFSDRDLDQHVPRDIRHLLGTPDQLKPDADQPVHATLYWIEHDSTSPSVSPSYSVLLYLKGSVTGDEIDDVKHYYATHPRFPHEGTSDQFFDEAQWESYRQLGHHIASPLVEDESWFWNIPLTGPA